MIEHLPKGTEIRSRDGKLVGVATGAQWKCRLEGCRGMRITVKWPNSITHPCSDGLVLKNGKWRIG